MLMSLCVGTFLLLTLLWLYPCYYDIHIIFSPHLLSTNHKCTQTCCSEAKEDLRFFDAEF
jgi:hypothetical protein